MKRSETFEKIRDSKVVNFFEKWPKDDCSDGIAVGYKLGGPEFESPLRIQ